MRTRIGFTGSSGVLGRSLIRKFNKKKFKIIPFQGNIIKKKDISNWIDKGNFKYIFHLAAIVPTQKVNNNYNYAKKVNYVGTKYLVDVINEKDSIDWIFFSSTSHVYGYSNKPLKETSKANPSDKYGKTKFLAEECIRKKLNRNKNFCIGRIFSLISLFQDKSFFLPSMLLKINKAKKNEIIEGNFNQFRDFISIEDVTNAIFKLFEKKSKGTFNIGSGKKVKLSYIVKLFSKELKKKIKLKIIKKPKIKNQFANTRKIKKEIKWKAKRNIDNIIKSFVILYLKKI